MKQIYSRHLVTKSMSSICSVGMAMKFLAGAVACLWALSDGPSISAFPPAPHHLVYGSVRDEYGTPLANNNALVILRTPSGITITGSILPGVAPGINYELQVPMDAGISADLYQQSALKTSAPFKIYVVTDQTVSTPIQMAGDYSLLGQPGEKTRLDLTLGVDVNNDGLPDAWEYAFLSTLGLNLTLADLNANMDLANNNRTLRQEFLLGYYPFDPGNALTLTLIDINGGAPLLEFQGMTGRSYTVEGSADLKEWTPLAFQIPGEVGGKVHSYYYSPGISTVPVQVIQPAAGPAMNFFQLKLQ
jgi:hypothetical protein